MPKDQRPEISYLVQHVLPVLYSQYDYPAPNDEKNVKIEEIPVRIGGSPKKPDCVYYWEENPVLLIESKKEGKTEKDAQDQASSYVKNYPVRVKEYSKNGIRPRFVATTVGEKIQFYECKYEISGADFKDWLEPINILAFKTLLARYGLSRGYKPKPLSPDEFREYFLYEMAKIYSNRDVITKDAIYNVGHQILRYLAEPNNYTSREPYVLLDNYKHKQAQIRHLFNQYNLFKSLTSDNAKEFRQFVLRAFQGTGLNQYMTEQCVIDFMINLVKPKSYWKVLDFECGSGGFPAAVADKGGVLLNNIKGIDIDPLPVMIAKTYLAIYFKIHGKRINDIPIFNDNGLFDNGNNWDLVISNPAGSSRYEGTKLQKVLKHLEADLNQDGRDESFSEYNFSAQQAVRSAKVGGYICLILPEGFFANSQNETLREFVLKYCKVLAIISLPRGVFRKGKDTKKSKEKGQIAQMKMSILYARKIKEVVKKSGVDLAGTNLNYPIFLADITDEGRTGEISDWLTPRLNKVLTDWRKKGY
ncbi:MAG: N-6 DNA methylase [Planctomycetota bacterium]